ncbi:MAG: ferritin [bacterium]
MISPKMQAALNKQMNDELFSSYLYLSMAAYFESKNYSGFAGWMKIQSSEEYGHALKFFHYIHEVGGKVELETINKPQHEWDSPKNAFEDALAHEHKITDGISNLVNLAIEEKDHATHIFLHWFVEEQVEEVAHSSSIVQKFDMVADSKNGLYLLDKELGQRQKG